MTSQNLKWISQALFYVAPLNNTELHLINARLIEQFLAVQLGDEKMG